MADEPTLQRPPEATVVDQHPLLTPKAGICVALLSLGLGIVGFVVAGRLIGVAGFVGALACCALIVWLYGSELRSAVRERTWRKDLVLPAVAVLIVAGFDALAVLGRDAKPAVSNAQPGASPSSSRPAPAAPAIATAANARTTAPHAETQPTAPTASAPPQPAGQEQRLAPPAQPRTKLGQPQSGRLPRAPSPPVTPTPAGPAVTDELLANARPYPEPYVPPTTPFSALTNQALRNRVASTCARLTAFEDAYNADAKTIAAAGANAGADQFPKVQKQLDDRRTAEIVAFQRDFIPELRALHFEMLNRLKLGPPDRYNRTFTAQAAEALNSGILMGGRPAGDACDYLSNLSARLGV